MTKRKASIALETSNESNQSSSTQDNSSNSTSVTNTTTGINNNQSAQNGSSAACSGRPQQQISDNSSGNNQQKSKKERADNWSSAEIQILHRGIETRRDIFYGPPNQATKKNRELAWEAITKEVNSVSTTPRSLGQVMKKFKNEKCRAKRKFIDADKDGHNNISNNGDIINNTSNTNNNGTNLNAQNHSNNNQPLQPQHQPHHMTTLESMSSQPPSISVVKLAPQNVAKTMIDLPGHVQQVQMPNDDMMLIVAPEMDGLLSGMNIVSDGNGHHHLQKCSSNSTFNNQQHNHHGQHTIQAINTGQGLVNGTMGNGMMARTIPAGSMCSLVYSTGGDVCGAEQHVTNSLTGPNQIATNHINVNAQNLMHHREQNQGQQQQQQQQQPQQPQQQPHHQLHQHPQQQTHQPQQSHQSAQHPQHHLQHNHLATTTAITNTGGVAVESQLKNLLFNLLLKDGQHTVPVVNSSQDYNKQRNDMLAIIASSLNKIEGHLSKISKVAGSLFAQNISSNSNDSGNISNSSSLSAPNNSLNITNNDGNNNNVNLAGTGSTNTINNQGGGET